MTSSLALISLGLTDALLRSSAENPSGIAATIDLDGRRTEIDFQTLVARSRSVAGLLRSFTEQGEGRPGLVGLFIEPSVDLAVATWAVMFAGGAYLPLEPEYPDERLRFMIDDSGLSTIITQPQHLARVRGLASSKVSVHALTDAEMSRPCESSGDFPVALKSQDLAYVIYTSGSTGQPKGVAITHGAISHQMAWLSSAGHLDAASVVIQKTPISFDAAQWELLANCVGARVVFTRHGAHRQPEELVRVVISQKVTTLQCVPTLWAALADEPSFPQCASLRRIYSGGEPLSFNLAARLKSLLPEADLVNLYGPTECTINATSHLVTLVDSDPSHIVSIGQAVDAMCTRIVDDALADVADGQNGELLIGGPQLATGYIGDPSKTAARFVHIDGTRYYRTGDIVHRSLDGLLHIHGRQDGQVKYNGHRIELDEISTRVEEHRWVRRAVATLAPDARTTHDQLVVCAELDPLEASLMDQGAAGAHHRSKSTRVQVRAQLAGSGVRRNPHGDANTTVELPLPADEGERRSAVFARKTYRRFLGEPKSSQDLAALLAHKPQLAPHVRPLGLVEIGDVLRWFGQFHSDDRLLAKYAYASPGALYAVQLYIAVRAVPGIDDGAYYYDPTAHKLRLIGDLPRCDEEQGVEFHFRGLPKVIEAVYHLNIREVLEFEAGHMVGTLDLALARFGSHAAPLNDQHDDHWTAMLAVPGEEDCYLGGVGVTSGPPDHLPGLVDTFLQVCDDRIDGLSAGLYQWTGATFVLRSDELVRERDVIAINQRPYRDASFGIALTTADNDRLAYVALGRALHLLQANPLEFGLMSSGYSSKSGHPLFAASRLEAILGYEGIQFGACYFALGGSVSTAQVASEGMDEDAVHMAGPAELIKEDLATKLPSYMLPSKVLLVEELPLSPSGKVDQKRIAGLVEENLAARGHSFVAPRTEHERWLTKCWAELLKIEEVSAADDFFGVGGSSLLAVRLASRVRATFGISLPMQDIFNNPRLDALARRIERLTQNSDGNSGIAGSRIIRLNAADGFSERPVFAWPGLGGSPLGLRKLSTLMKDRAFYGVQALGLNVAEEPLSSVVKMAEADLEEIRRVQPSGPYNFVGYSFGARVAFEAAWQLERAGEKVTSLVLLCPGNPLVEGESEAGGPRSRIPTWQNKQYVRILWSVFTGTLYGDAVDELCAAAVDEETFIRHIIQASPGLDRDILGRIIRVVETTFAFDYEIEELAERRLNVPVRVVKADGDDYSFVDDVAVLNDEGIWLYKVKADHYSILREDVGELISLIKSDGFFGSTLVSEFTNGS